MEKINKNIYRTTTPYKDIFTSLYIVKTAQGDLLFDAASFDSDVNEYIIPFLEFAGVTSESLTYIFISHAHGDHMGGLPMLIKEYPNATIVSRSAKIKEDFRDYSVLMPNDNDLLLDCIKVITIVGHTEDSAAILDTRTNTLITGDCLQLSGIFGSGKWGANINFPAEHLKALNKVKKLTVDEIYTAHDYHPCGYKATTPEDAQKMLCECEVPLMKVKELISANPALNDEEIAALYNSPALPTMGSHVVSAMRSAMKKGLI